jgi:hypothetical protein
MRRLRRIRVLDSELPSGQISYQTKLCKCFDNKYWLACRKLNRLVVGLLFVDAKTLRLVLLYDHLDISKILVLYRRGLVSLLRITSFSPCCLIRCRRYSCVRNLDCLTGILRAGSPEVRVGLSCQ